MIRSLRFLILTAFLLSSAIAPAQITQTPSPTPPSNSAHAETAALIAIMKDCVNIVFFVIVGTVAVLTFRQAKKTIFTPFRTETFKLQLKAFEDVLLFFEKHPSLHIDDEFDFDRIVYLNTIKLVDAYAFSFFEDQLKKDEMAKDREELFKDLVGGFVTKDFFEKHFELPTHLREPTGQDSDETPSNPALVLAKWNQYQHGMIEFTKRHESAAERLQRFGVSPLLPKDLKKLISEFAELVTDNLKTAGSVLTDVAKELPIKYPTSETLQKADLSWIWNEYNHRRIRLEEKQNAILMYLEKYLEIDNLLERKA
jgi:hypothetical protein